MIGWVSAQIVAFPASQFGDESGPGGEGLGAGYGSDTMMMQHHKLQDYAEGGGDDGTRTRDASGTQTTVAPAARTDAATTSATTKPSPGSKRLPPSEDT